MLSKQINLFFENQSSFYLGVYCISSHIFCHWWFDMFLSPWTTKPCIIPCNCLLRYEGKKPLIYNTNILGFYIKSITCMIKMTFFTIFDAQKRTNCITCYKCILSHSSCAKQENWQESIYTGVTYLQVVIR